MTKSNPYFCAVIAAGLIFLSAPVFSAEKPNTNVQVEGETDFMAYINRDKKEPESKFKIIGDEETSVGIDGDGNPALNSRF